MVKQWSQSVKTRLDLKQGRLFSWLYWARGLGTNPVQHPFSMDALSLGTGGERRAGERRGGERRAAGGNHAYAFFGFPSLTT